MTRAIDQLQMLKQRAKNAAVPGNREYNPGWHTAMDLRNLLIVSEAVARAAVDRKESRGAHSRTDHPDKSDDYARHNTILKQAGDGDMQVERRPIPPMPAELTRIIEENK